MNEEVQGSSLVEDLAGSDSYKIQRTSSNDTIQNLCNLTKTPRLDLKKLNLVKVVEKDDEIDNKIFFKRFETYK